MLYRHIWLSQEGILAIYLNGSHLFQCYTDPKLEMNQKKKIDWGVSWGRNQWGDWFRYHLVCCVMVDTGKDSSQVWASLRLFCFAALHNIRAGVVAMV
jgi:hypothetical protein